MAHSLLQNLAGTLAATLLLTAVASAQSGRRTMAIDDGQGRRVLSWTEPDMDFVMRPDVIPMDVRLYRDHLTLSEAQAEAVGRLIDEYTEAFTALVDEKQPDVGAGPGFNRRRGPGGPGDAGPGGRGGPGGRARGPDGGPDGGPGGGPDRGPDGGPGGADPMRDVMIDELKKAGLITNSMDELPVEPRVAIGIDMMTEDAEGNPLDEPEPNVSVNVSFGSDDDTLDAATRAKLQAAADKIAPRLTEMARERAMSEMAQGMAEGGMSPDDEIENRWQEVLDLRARVDDFLREKGRLLDRLNGEVRYLLAESQLEQWTPFLEAFTRYKTLALAELDGEGTDLIRVLEDLDPGDDEMDNAAPALANYSRQLHQMLTRRNKLLETAEAEIDQALYRGDIDRALSLTDKLIGAREDVRDVNDRSMRAIATTLSPEASATFMAAALKTSFPRVFHETIGSKAFAEAAQLETLTADQTVAIDELRANYTVALASVNDRILSTIRKEQIRQLRQGVESVAATMDPNGERRFADIGDARRAMNDSYRARRELDSRRMTTLYAVLLPEQVATLPPIPTYDVAEPVTASSGDIELDVFSDSDHDDM